MNLPAGIKPENVRQVKLRCGHTGLAWPLHKGNICGAFAVQGFTFQEMWPELWSAKGHWREDKDEHPLDIIASGPATTALLQEFFELPLCGMKGLA